MDFSPKALPKEWPPKTVREDIIRVLDEEDAWVHVVMNYISGQVDFGRVRLRKDKTPDLRYNIGRIVRKLNATIGDVEDFKPFHKRFSSEKGE